MADNNIFQSYISKVFVETQTQNSDVITIETNFLSPEGDTFTLERRVLEPTLLKTTSSINELKPEVSDVYPYKIVTPTLNDGTTLLVSPSIDTPVTASQNYYVPIYFERYSPDILRRIDREFTELLDINLVTDSEPSPFEDPGVV
jgi:hypothetical protein